MLAALGLLGIALLRHRSVLARVLKFLGLLSRKTQAPLLDDSLVSSWAMLVTRQQVLASLPVVLKLMAQSLIRIMIPLLLPRLE